MFFVKKIGYLAIAYWGCQLYKNVFQRVYKVFFTPDCNIDLKKMGKWCMVAGCTQGIGRAYVEALAKRRMCVVLVDAPSNNLYKFAKFIESSYNVQTKIIELDISKEYIRYEIIEGVINDLEIGVLINNLNLSHDLHPEYFLDLNDNERIYNDIIRCNITVFTNICRILLPQMVERKRGVVVNIASTFAVIPSPLMTVFAASKAYVIKFSKDLAVEYEKSGVTIQCLCPASISTNISDTVSDGWITPHPKKYVESAIATIGKDNITTGYFSHTILIGFLKLVHHLSSTTLIEWILTFMQRNRRRALHKYINNN
ncbi:hypothetical protein PV327_007785 [Microctonus hyperodae]|uniref:Uncharacterized protein n=1 Tax=Microctonus hyperodae TaxID=165561 RepID=A0AA39G086_MICHY|nr:hypothetical protein PV327_007785 [Microctonus hyperodae]